MSETKEILRQIVGEDLNNPILVTRYIFITEDAQGRRCFHVFTKQAEARRYYELCQRQVGEPSKNIKRLTQAVTEVKAIVEQDDNKVFYLLTAIRSGNDFIFRD